MRRLGLLLAVVVLAALGAFGAIAFFNARDDAGVETPTGTSPGVPLSQLSGVQAPATTAGNVVLLYSDDGSRAALDALAEDIAGPPSPEVEEAGQAVLVRKSAAGRRHRRHRRRPRAARHGSGGSRPARVHRGASRRRCWVSEKAH